MLGQHDARSVLAQPRLVIGRFLRAQPLGFLLRETLAAAYGARAVLPASTTVERPAKLVHRAVAVGAVLGGNGFGPHAAGRFTSRPLSSPVSWSAVAPP